MEDEEELTPEEMLEDHEMTRKDWRVYKRWGAQMDKAIKKQYRDERAEAFRREQNDK